MSKILEGMVTAYHRKLEPRSDMSGWHHDDAMRAALLWFADNVSDEMASAYLECKPTNPRNILNAIRESIAAALRQAAGGGE